MGNGFGISAQLYDAAGVAVGAAFHVNSTSANGQYYSASTALDDGGFVVTWGSQNQDGDGVGIYAQRFDATGAPVGAEARINDVTAGDQEFPSVTERADGSLVFVWNSGGHIVQKIVELDEFLGKSLVGGPGSDSLRGSELQDTIHGMGGDRCAQFPGDHRRS